MTSSTRCFILALSICLLTGCGVSSFKAHNWNPINPDDISTELYRTKNLDLCRQQAMIPAAADVVEASNPNSRNIESYANINKSMMISCMENKGYKLRPLTDIENTTNYFSAPFILPLKIIGKNFDDIY